MWGFIPHAVGENQDGRRGLGFSRICKCLCNGLSSGFSPLSFSPVGEMQVTLTIDNRLIIRHKSIYPSPSGEARWGLMTIFRVVTIGLELSLNFISFVVFPVFVLNHISLSPVLIFPHVVGNETPH